MNNLNKKLFTNNHDAVLKDLINKHNNSAQTLVHIANNVTVLNKTVENLKGVIYRLELDNKHLSFLLKQHTANIEVINGNLSYLTYRSSGIPDKFESAVNDAVKAATDTDVKNVPIGTFSISYY